MIVAGVTELNLWNLPDHGETVRMGDQEWTVYMEGGFTLRDRNDVTNAHLDCLKLDAVSFARFINSFL